MESNAQFPVGLRVLVVDDDVTCLRILDHMLRRCRYRVTTCCKATVALSLLRERTDGFDVVISDVHMPDMNGFKLLELVGLEMDLPVIMMSADEGTNTVMRGIKHGACDYLIKPVRIEELKNIWQHVIRRKRNESRELACSVGTNNSYRNKQVADDAGYASSPNDEADESWKSYKKKGYAKEDEDDGELDHEDPSLSKKPRIVWSAELHQQFVSAVNQLGIEKALPKQILELMNVPGLTRENVASHLQKFRLYLKRISDIAWHQNGHPSFLRGPQEHDLKVVGRLDFQALETPGQIPTQTLAALRTEFLDSPSGSLAFPSIDSPVLQASRQGSKCILTEREITFGQPLFKFESSIREKILPTSVAGENASSFISLWPSYHLDTTDSIKNHGVAISTLNDNMMPVLHQKQSYQPPSESHHVINVQPSCLVVPSVSSKCMNDWQSSLAMTQNSIVIPSQSSSIFQTGSSYIDNNPSSSFNNSSIAVEYSLLPSVSNDGPTYVGLTSDGDILNATLLNGSPGSIASSVSSCSARADSNNGWLIHNSNINVNPVNGLPVKLPNLCIQDSEQKLWAQSDQRQIKNLGFVGEGTFVSHQFTVDNIESHTNSQRIGNTFISDDGDRAKQQLHFEFMDNFRVPNFSSSNFMGVLSKDGFTGSLLRS